MRMGRIGPVPKPKRRLTGQPGEAARKIIKATSDTLSDKR